MLKKKTIIEIYQKLLKYYGKQNWWPAETEFEVIVGAILTQQTNWKNAEKAIKNLKKNFLLSPFTLYNTSIKDLELIIKPSGFYKVKTKRLKNFVNYIIKKYNGEIIKMKEKKEDFLRKELLEIKGIGKETADSILLYALSKKTFIVDTYTFRFFKRYGLTGKNNYEEIKKTVENAFGDKEDTVYNLKELHALIVEHGKNFCKKIPKCTSCPLTKECKKKGVINE